MVVVGFGFSLIYDEFKFWVDFVYGDGGVFEYFNIFMDFYWVVCVCFVCCGGELDKLFLMLWEFLFI